MTQLIHPKQSPIEIAPVNGKYFTRNELKQYLNCELIQVIDIGNKQIMIIDEEGKLVEKAKKMNPVATVMAAHVLYSYDCIVGSAIICPAGMVV